MNSSATGATVLFGLLAFGLFLVMHALIWQIISRRRKGVQLLVGLAGLAGLLTMLLHGLIYPTWAVRYYAALPLWAALVMLYLHLYVGLDRSVSIRILGELYQAPRGSLALDQLKKSYSGADMVRRRVDLMCAENWLAEKDGRYYCGRKALWLARLAVLIQKFYGIEEAG